ncbi:2-C-methyl-D-erythritol 4-phosphate cytidylyltransferase [Crocinitomix catalasitica]|nr:2-C-methyl-D-erythritol 4-phosphate cytidylyltransferase [Crocinitomix catalasitica]
MTKSVIISAGGRGHRLEGDLPKQFIQINGQPILSLCIRKFFEYDSSIQIIVTLPEDEIDRWSTIQRECSFEIDHEVVAGGENRFQSVKNALAWVKGDLLAIHDGVRPFVANSVIQACFLATEKIGSAIPVMPLSESIRIVGEGTSKSMDRTDFRNVQTPQVFRTEEIKEAYEQAYSDEFTDDASVFEAAGGSIQLVDGNVENLKITTPLDLEFANLMFGSDH